jgi:hypothetical protein
MTSGPDGFRVQGPDFLCIGLQKAGTRWLFDQLSFRAGFWMPPIKELHFFDQPFPDKRLLDLLASYDLDPAALNVLHTSNYGRALDARDAEFFSEVRAAGPARLRSIDGYAKLFAPKGALLSGELTPGYSVLDDEHIAALSAAFPELRVILLLRDPVARAWSQLCMNVEEGRTAPEPLRDEKRLIWYLKKPLVEGRSFPSRIATRWRRHFGERLGFFFFDDIVGRPENALQAILRHIGASAEPGNAPIPVDFNRVAIERAVPKPVATPAIAKLLEEHFREERVLCAEMFGGPALAWPHRTGA